MRGKLKPIKIILTVALLYFSINTTLFILREFNAEWWISDYQAYADVAFDLHASAFVFFILYLLIFVLLLVFISRKSSCYHDKVFNNRDESCYFNKNKRMLLVLLFVLFLLMVQFLLALIDSVGVAAGTGKAPLYALPILLLSPDGIYYAYALSDKNKKRFFIATIAYVLSNIVRGWAGFVVPLMFILYIRNNGFSKKTFFYSVIIFIIIMPILFSVRDYFRGGYSNYQMLLDSGLVGASLFIEYSILSIKLILSRFDLYSHYIGIYQNFGNGIPDYVCIPIIENLFTKISLYFFGGLDCLPLGEVLPKEMYSYFVDKGTSFAVVGGFFALPFVDALTYFFSYLFVLFLSSIIIFRIINIYQYSIFFIFLVMVLLFQGWMYQFVYNFIGFLAGIYLMKIRWMRLK